MKTSTVRSIVPVVKLEPSEGMHLRNKLTGEVYESHIYIGYIYVAKSLSIDDFDEITEEEYQQIIAEEETREQE